MQFHEFSILITEPASFEELGDILGTMYNFLETQESIVSVDVVASQGYSLLLFIGAEEDVSFEDIQLKVIESFANTSRPADNFMLV
jgi:hypothetical protein